MKYVILLLSLLLFTSCSNTDIASLKAIGKPGTIACYSGTKLIYSGSSTGRIQTVAHSDGWEFQEADSNKFIRVSGSCVIKN